MWTLLLLTSLAGAEDPPLPNLVEYERPTRSWCSPDGMLVVALEDHAVPVARVRIVLDVGGSDVPADKAGLPMVTEHLWFWSTTEEGPVLERLRALGSGADAYTSQDTTSFGLTTSTATLDQALGVGMTLFTNPLGGVGESDFAIERDVVRNELGPGAALGTKSGQPTLLAQIFSEHHRYARPIGGTHASLDALTLADAKEFAATHYHRDGATLLVVSDATLDETETVLRKHLPDLGEAGASCTKPERPEALTKPDLPAVARGSIVGTTGERVLTFGWSVPPFGDNPTPLLALWMVDHAINRELQSENRMTCGSTAMEQATLVRCSVVLGEADSPERVEQEAMDGLASLWQLRDADEQERWFQLARQRAIRSLALEVEDPMAQHLVRDLHLTHEPTQLAARVAGVAAVDLHNASLAAQHWFSPERRTTLLVEPGDIVRDGQRPWFHPRANTEPPPAPTGTLDPTLLVSRQTLRNGLQVVLAPHGEVPLVHVELSFRRGPEPESGIDDLAWASRFPRSWRRAPDHGPFLVQGTGESAFYQGGVGPTEELESLLERLAATASLPANGSAIDRLGPGMAERMKERVAGHTGLEQARAWSRELLFGLHGPYRHDSDQLASEIGWRTERQLTDRVDELFHPSNGTLLVVGGFDPTVAAALIEDSFESWNGTGRLYPREPDMPEAPPRSTAFVPQEAGRTLVEISCRMSNASESNWASRRLLERYLEHLGARELRHQSGITSHVDGHLVDAGDSTGMLELSAWVQSDSVREAVDVMLVRLQRTAKGDIDELGFARARQAVAAGHLAGFATAGAAAEQLGLAIHHGWELDTVVDMGSAAAALEADALPPLLNECAGHEAIVISGPSAVLEQLDGMPGLVQFGTSVE